MTSGGPSSSLTSTTVELPDPSPPSTLHGPVDVCVAVPLLSLDRPFTYVLPEGSGGGLGSLVSVPFHGRTVKGWVLGPAREVPQGRLLGVRRVRSPVRFFDPSMLRLLRWVSERYLAPLATVIERSHPPRVAGEEAPRGDPSWSSDPGHALESTRNPHPAIAPGATAWLRPLPGEEGAECLRAVRTCLAAGRRALVLVPEADPSLNPTAAILAEFREQAVAYLGGDDRTRYRMWLDIQDGRYRVVVGTRPAVFAPLPELGVIWVSREVHPGHREERAPHHHVRDVAMARSRFEGCACVLASLSPSSATVAAIDRGTVRVLRPPRSVERRRAPLVETAPPEAEDRSTRLARLLATASSAALIVSRRGYGVARACRDCGEPAGCAVCSGPIVLERGAAKCPVCGATARCASCGGTSFGIERGGTERVAEWARRVARTRVDVEAEGEGPSAVRPGPGKVMVGTAASVRDGGPVDLDLVAILDPDRALRRPGVAAGERALATWMEAAAWAAPRTSGGRVLCQTRRPSHPAVQALVRWEPVPYLRREGALRAEAGFPPGHPVFRVSGGEGLDAALGGTVGSLLSVPAEGGTVCLVTVPPERLPRFRRDVLQLVEEGLISRVDAEPQL